jgi:hypothetical protein
MSYSASATLLLLTRRQGGGWRKTYSAGDMAYFARFVITHGKFPIRETSIIKEDGSENSTAMRGRFLHD